MTRGNGSEGRDEVARVLVVDDSALIRKLLVEQLAGAGGVEVVGTAINARIAEQKVHKLRPDVLLLDMQLPGEGGLDLLRRLSSSSPIPTVVFSSHAGPGSTAALEALELGAVAIVCKPDGGQGVEETLGELRRAIRGAARAKVRRRRARARAQTRLAPIPSAAERISRFGGPVPGRVIAIGTSTGGTDALKEVLAALPENMPPMLAVIHMPKGFTARFANRLNRECAVEVLEAADRVPLHPGLVLLAPGGVHMLVTRCGSGHEVRLQAGPKVERQRPAVDVLFGSMATHVGSNGLGILLTGMGRDGATGLLAMREAGAHTIGQDEESCVVYGMPRQAALIGAVRSVLPLSEVAGSCVTWAYGQRVVS